MRLNLISIFALFLLVSEVGEAKAHFWDRLEPGKDYLADEVVVEIVISQESLRYERAGKTWKEKVFRGCKTNEAKRLMSLAKSLGCELVKKLGTLPFYEFRIPKGQNPTRVCEEFELHTELVKLAEPNGIEKPFYAPYAFPNDVYYQDGLSNWNLAVTALDKTWNTTTGGMNIWSQGSATVGIAILDSGINNAHEDLIGQTVTGYNVLNGTSDTTDTFGHGTHVASVACVTTNNGKGIAGGAILSKILPVKVFNTGGVVATDSATGINWAATNGAKVINMSYGGPTPWAPEQAACDDAYLIYGVVLVAGTGNSCSLGTNYPAGDPHVIAVGGSTSLDQWWTCSTYGPIVSFISPQGIPTCLTDSSSAYWANEPGTSIASPGVAGLAAILVSNGVPFYECVSRIARTCDKIDSVAHPYATVAGYPLGTWNQYLGYGRINHYRAMCTLVPPTLDTATPGVGSVALSWTAPALFDSPTSGYNIYRATVSGGPYTLVYSVLSTQNSYTDISNQGGFPFYYVLKAVDSNGFETRASNELSAIPSAPTPSATPTSSPTFTQTVTFSISPTFTPSPTVTVTLTPCSAIYPKISTLAGTGTMGYGGDNGPATAALLNYSGIKAWVDPYGSLFFPDNTNNRIRKVAPDGIISTVAGNGNAASNGDNGPATTASLYHPSGVWGDSLGNLYISETAWGKIRRVDSAGIIHTLAGGGATLGDGGPATAASLNAPEGLWLDSFGDLYFADFGNNRLRKVDTSGVITTVAGNGSAGLGGDNGPATAASFNAPSDVWGDSSGNLFIADLGNEKIRKVNALGVISTFAGTGTAGFGGDNGPATAALLNNPQCVFGDRLGNLLIADELNNRIRGVDSSGNIRTLAGSGAQGYSGDGGAATVAALNRPYGVAEDGNGVIYILDTYNQRIRQAICLCVLPSPTSSPSLMPSATPTPSATGTSTASPSGTATSSPASSATPLPSRTSSPTASASGTATLSATISATYTTTPTLTPTASVSETFTDSPTFSSSPTCSLTFTMSPTPTVSQTFSETFTFTSTPTVSPVYTPTFTPTITLTPLPKTTNTAAYSEPLEIQKLLLVPNPLFSNNARLALCLKGSATHFRLRVYTSGYDLMQKREYDLDAGPGWITLPVYAQRWPDGLLFLLITAENGMGSSSAMAKALVRK